MSQTKLKTQHSRNIRSLLHNASSRFNYLTVNCGLSAECIPFFANTLLFCWKSPVNRGYSLGRPRRRRVCRWLSRYWDETLHLSCCTPCKVICKKRKEMALMALILVCRDTPDLCRGKLHSDSLSSESVCLCSRLLWPSALPLNTATTTL